MTTTTTTPSTQMFGGAEAYVRDSGWQTEKEIQELFNIPGKAKSCVGWNGHQFEILDFTVENFGEDWNLGLNYNDDNYHSVSLYESNMLVYYPLDPRTNETDWRGAILAKPNKTNTAWIPEHCDTDYMQDREVEIVSIIRTSFQPEIDELDYLVKIATDNKPRNWPIGTPWENRTVRLLKWLYLTQFREEVVKQAIKDARERYIGWYHQNPHLSHLHNIVHDSITKVAHASSEKTSYIQIQENVRKTAASLAPHQYETRWDREARLERERKAKEAETNEGTN